jgi:hypothetical protein
MADPVSFPGRGIVFANPVPKDQGGGMLIGCDCGFNTQIVVEWDHSRPVPAQEIAFTCGGCQSAHWLTIGPPDVTP